MSGSQSLQASPLGRETAYPDRIDATILFPISRADARASLPWPQPAPDALPFVGEDGWTAWELSWLDERGRPRIAVARLTVPADSVRLVESKSLKLYLNGYAGTSFRSPDQVVTRIGADLGQVLGASIGVELSAGAAIDALAVTTLPGESIDEIDIEIGHYGPVEPAFLGTSTDRAVEETLVSRLFRSNCPVTGQPDWADVQIRYRGPAIDRAGLLRYLVSFRESREFHEHCVERIWLDIHSRCRPQGLRVHARFTRRGGIDINPWRAHDAAWAPMPGIRTARQ